MPSWMVCHVDFSAVAHAGNNCRAFEMFVTIDESTWHNIQESMNLQQHSCKNLKSCTVKKKNCLTATLVGGSLP
jgi:hypothetical protein